MNIYRALFAESAMIPELGFFASIDSKLYFSLNFLNNERICDNSNNQK